MRNTLLAILACSSALQAGTVALHSGMNSPLTEGWTGSSCCDTVGPDFALASDLGRESWAMQVPSAFGQFGYVRSLTTTERDAALATGWRMTIVARIVPLGRTPIDPVFRVAMAFSTGSKRYDFDVFGGRIGVNDRVFSGRNEQNRFVQADTSVYHWVELTSAPGSSTADLWLDGVKVLSDYAGHTDFLFGNAVSFGSFYGPGQGNINLIKFETGVWNSGYPAPEPSAWALVVPALTGLLALRRRRSA